MLRVLRKSVANAWRQILEQILCLLECLNKDVHSASVFDFTLVSATLICIVFDVYQACTGGPVAFWLSSAVSAVLGTLALLYKVDLGIEISDEMLIKVTAYWIPCTLIALAIVFGLYHDLGADADAYALNGVMAFVTAVLPSVTAGACALVAPLLTSFLTKLEHKVAGCVARR
jgi:hypothetical protein